MTMASVQLMLGWEEHHQNDLDLFCHSFISQITRTRDMDCACHWHCESAILPLSSWSHI